MDHIAAQLPQAGLDRIAQPSEHGRHQVAAEQGLAHHLWSQEQPLEQQAVQIETGAPLTADARRREPAAGLLHQLAPASHVAACGSDGAAQVLDQRAGHQVRSNGSGLLQLHQLAIAVIHKHHTAGLNRLDPLHQPTDLRHRKRRPPAVATAALNQHHPRRHGQGLGDAGLIDAAIGEQLEFVVDDAELRQGALAAAADADHLFKGVVGAAGEGQQAITGTQHAVERRGDGMGAAHELEPHGRGLGLQHPGEHPIEHLTAQVAMAVAAHRGEVMHPETLGRKGRQHPLQPWLHAGAALGRQGRAALNGLSQLIGSPGGRRDLARQAGSSSMASSTARSGGASERGHDRRENGFMLPRGIGPADD